jgi:phage terminase large subunit
VFSNWKIDNFIDTGFTFFGQDYGFSIDPTTLVKCSIDKSNKIIYVKEFLYKSGLTTSHIAEVNLLNCGKSLIIADSAEPRLISELKSKGCNIKGISKPKIIDRIALLQDFTIIVDSESKNIIKELNNYVWHDKKSETPIDAYNHLLDPIGYVLWDSTARPIQISGSSNYSTL